MTVEVFKTNVNDKPIADKLIAAIHKKFAGYKANFDLDDCDRILRIQCDKENINCISIINFLDAFGYYAEILID